MIIARVLVFFCTVTILLLAGILAGPWFIEHTTLGSKVRSEISRLIDGSFDYKQVDLSFFPVPHLLLVQAKITLPRQVTGLAESIEIYPQIGPLFTGHFTLKRAVVNGPAITVVLPDSTAESKKPSRPFEMSRVLPTVANVLARLPEFFLPVTSGTITGGSLTLVSGNKTVFSLRDVEAEIQNRSKKVTFQAKATSDIFAQVSTSGSIEEGQGDMNVHAGLKKVQFGKVYAFFPDNELKIEDGETDITADLTIENSRKLTMNFELAAPMVRLERAGERVAITIRRLAGSLGFNGDAATLTLTELLLDNPAMRLSGSFLVSGQDPQFRLELEGRDIDLTAARSAALSLAAGNTVLKSFFDIVKGGTIPHLTVSSQAKSLVDLGDWAHLTVQSNILQADVEIPGVNLDFNAVSGDVALSRGILAGEKIEARLRNSAIQGGQLKLDLTKDPLPLHFETGIHADLADIPPILAKVIDDRDVNRELALIEDIKGTATGKLLLDGDTDQLKVEVSATDIQCAARYPEIPYPLTIAGGSVSYDGEHIAWEQVNGSLGTSTFAALSGRLDLGKTKDFKVTSGTSHILLSELLPWISSYEKIRGLSSYYGGGKGILQLSELTLDGPLQDFHRWHFNIAGEVEDLVVQNVPDYPGAITISALKFTADPDNLAYSDGQLAMLDTSLTVSGRHRRYMTDFTRDISLSFDGQVGPQTTRWLEQMSNTPSWLKIQPFSLTASHLNYARNGKRKMISLTLGLVDGLEVFGDLSLDAKDLVVEKLIIKDNSSRVMLNGRYKDQSLAVSFDGKLHASAAGKLFQIPAGSNGFVEGKAQIRLNMKNPYDVRFAGR